MLKDLIKKAKSEKEKPKQQPEEEAKQIKEALALKWNKYIESGSYLKSLKEVDYKEYKIGNIASVYYIPNFISREDEEYILYEIYNAPERFISLKHARRRLQKWGGDVQPEGLVGQEPLPSWLESVSEKLCELKITEKKTNHALINEYEPDVGIMPHTDGPLYHPFVCILSLGSSTGFKFFEDYAKYKEDDELAHLLIEPRSLFIFTHDAYGKFLHCIEDKKLDIVSFTLEKADTAAEPKILKSNIDNLKYTSLYEQAVSSLDSGVTQVTRELVREKRISITIRNITTKKSETEADVKQE